jgi:septal ring-binding cell division protein DamX
VADAAWARLEGREGPGKSIYRYQTQIDGVPYTRIRLGFFATQQEAQEAARALSAELGLSPPWSVRPTVAEERQYAKAAPAAANAAAETPSYSRFWVVNISSTQDGQESESIWSALNGAPAKAALGKAQTDHSPDGPISLYRYETQLDGAQMYRIRLGFFESAAAAEAAGRAMTEAASLGASRIGTPWTVHPTADEERTHKKN